MRIGKQSDSAMMPRKARPIFRKIFIPLFCLMILQSIIFYGATVYGGVVGALNQNANDILMERVINRENELETKFNANWANLSPYTASIDALYHTEEQDADQPVYTNPEAEKEFLKQVYPILINILRTNGTNGVFMILNDSEDYQSPEDGGSSEKYGLCIRDYDPASGYTDKEDLLVLRCPSSIVPDMGCALETGWEALYHFDSFDDGAFYYEPLQAAYENPGVESDNLAYFCGTHNFTGTDKTVVSYSLPLLDEYGRPYAVLGIELTTSYLESMLPSEELYGNNIGCYALVEHETDSKDYTLIAHNGILFQRWFGQADTFTAQSVRGSYITYQNRSNNILLRGTISDLGIYNKNTPFEHTKLSLVGFVEESKLYEFGDSVKRQLLFVSFIVLLIGCLGIFFVSRNITAPIKRLAGKVRSMDARSTPILERLNINEIDELVNAIEELSRNINQNQVRTEFFSRMSHDMRTPMNAIIGFSSPEILDGAQDWQKDEYLSKIHASGNYLLGLINEVLDMTKIESKKMELSETPMSIQDFWADTMPIIDEVAKQKSVQFKTDIVKEDSCIYADRQRLSQIFINLLSNAVKFTPKGGTVTLIAELIQQNTTEVTHRFVVRDTGIGMSEQFLKRLYQPFVQENPGKEGTGLGLSITKQLVELMGGTIVCNSKQGYGTEFVVVLTHRLATPTPKKQTQVGVQTGNTDLSGKRVLLCEDHPLNIQIAKRLLEKWGMIVTTAENGAIGVNCFSSSQLDSFDVILMDIRMPVMDGLEAAKAIRELHRSDAQSIPIIAMTANAFAEDMRNSAEVGMDEHLSKPIEPEKLHQVLVQYLCRQP